MDGVLVDATASYRAVTVQTVRRYCSETLGLGEPPVDASWIAALKDAGGFNNDWDLTAALIRGVAARGAALDVAAYAAELTAAGGGPSAVEGALGALTGSDVQALSARGPLMDLFQELYLGEARFIDREELLCAPATLTALRDRLPLAIATGRPRGEAEYALARFGVADRFGALVAHDDVLEAGARGKPDPWCLLEAVERLGLPSDAWCAYVGDTPDDMRAAVAAHHLPIGVTHTADSAVLVAAGARLVLSTADALPEQLAAWDQARRPS